MLDTFPMDEVLSPQGFRGRDNKELPGVKYRCSSLKGQTRMRSAKRANYNVRNLGFIALIILDGGFQQRKDARERNADI
jgi:hypothetical protein